MGAEAQSQARARKTLIQRGEVWAAYDLARTALDAGEATPEIAHDAVLCLARSGAVDLALSEYHRLALDGRHDRACRALGARLLKDSALRQQGPDRRALALKAAHAYGAVHAAFGGIHSLVNEAMLLLVAGDDRSQEVARLALHLPPPPNSADDAAHYYDLAARAEASLIRRDLSAARSYVATAARRAPEHIAARISTLRQLDLIADLLDEPRDWIAPLRPRPTAHFTGHIYLADASQPSTSERTVQAALAQALREHDIGVVFGGLAAGGDILWAEAALSMGVDLNVVLPMNVDAYRQASVAPYGEAWVARYDACLARAASVRFSSTEDYLGDAETFIYGARYAMGCATADAELKATTALQLILSEHNADESGFTELDAQWWAQTGRPQIRIAADELGPSRMRPCAKSTLRSDRSMRAMLFIDVKGFGRLDDARTPVFFDTVMGALGRSLASLATGPCHMETWGDGVFLVFEAPDAAADAALAILDGHAELDLAARGLPDGLQVRIGGHYGPVYLRTNPLTNGPAVVGANVVAAARIEPDAMPGSVYVSEPFAGWLTARHSARFRCHYVGQSSGHKGTTPRPLFSLSPR